MTLDDAHLRLLALAAEAAYGGGYAADLDAIRAEERAGTLGWETVRRLPVDPRPLAVRMGLGERDGVRIARDLERHGYLQHYVAHLWDVTADGAAAAGDDRAARPARGVGSTPPVAVPPAAAAAARCPRCDADLGVRRVRFCPRCGVRRSGGGPSSLGTGPDVGGPLPTSRVAVVALLVGLPVGAILLALLR